MEQTKTCTRCGETKTLDQFARKTAKTLRGFCKACDNKRARNRYYARNRVARFPQPKTKWPGLTKLQHQLILRLPAEVRNNITVDPCAILPKDLPTICPITGVEITNIADLIVSSSEGNLIWYSRDYFYTQQQKYPEASDFQKRCYKNTKLGAKIRNIEHTVTPADFPEELPTTCPYLSIPLTPDNFSVDRFDNSKGYIPGNILIVSSKGNRIKNDATLSELKIFIKNLQKLLP